MPRLQRICPVVYPGDSATHMLLPGRLGRMTLGDLLGRLHRAGVSGALELSTHGRRHHLVFRRGLIAGIRLEDDSKISSLGEILVREGLVDQADVNRALDIQERAQATQPENGFLPKTGDLLVRLGLVRPEVRDGGLRKQARAYLERLFALVHSTNAEIRFQVGVGAAALPTLPSPLMPRDFLQGRPRERETPHPPAAHQSPRVSPVEANASHASQSGSAVGRIARLQALRKLGLTTDADERTIRQAFRQAAAKIHPDRVPSPAGGTNHTAFAELSAAYHLLCA